MRAIQEAAQEQKIPRGVGPLTFEILRREVGDWSRFNNRLQVSSYTGLCPREHRSGGKRRAGSVSKSGNPRVRAMLVEMVWRMIRWQRGLSINCRATPGPMAKNHTVANDRLTTCEPPPRGHTSSDADTADQNCDTGSSLAALFQNLITAQP